MIVRHDDRCGVDADRLTEELAHAHHGSVEGTHIDVLNFQDLILGVEDDRLDMLLLQTTMSKMR